MTTIKVTIIDGMPKTLNIHIPNEDAKIHFSYPDEDSIEVYEGTIDKDNHSRYATYIDDVELLTFSFGKEIT